MLGLNVEADPERANRARASHLKRARRYKTVVREARETGPVCPRALAAVFYILGEQSGARRWLCCSSISQRSRSRKCSDTKVQKRWVLLATHALRPA